MQRVDGQAELMLAQNRAVLHMLRKAGAVPARIGGGLVHAEIALIPSNPSKPENRKEKR